MKAFTGFVQGFLILTVSHHSDNARAFSVIKIHLCSANNKKRGISPERTWFYTAQITLGLDHLHASQILYR